MYRRLFLSLTAVFAASVHADDTALADLAGRIEYSFYAQNDRELQQAVKDMSAMEADSSVIRLSWLNYGRWKLAQRLSETQPTLAAQAADQCASEHWPAKMSKDMQATALALQAACHELLADLRPVRGVLYRRDRDRQIAQALQQGGEVAQVMLVSSWLAVRAKDTHAAYPRLQKGVRLYDLQERTGQQRADNWGQAELNFLLGTIDMQRGDALAARNDLERALIIAADYRDAASLLKTLSVK